jgi:hypothetical protein
VVCGPKNLSTFCRRWKHKNVVHGMFHSLNLVVVVVVVVVVFVFMMI